MTCLGTERGLETRLVPQRGYPAGAHPGRAAAAVAHARGCSPCPAGWPARDQRRRRRARPDQGRRARRASAATSPPLPTWQRGGARCRSWCTRRTPCRAWPTGWAPGSPPTCSPATRTPSSRNGQYIGIPLRREIADLDRLDLGDKARAHFGLRPDLPVLLVTGGSQGARSLNRAVFEARRLLREAGRPDPAHRRPEQRPSRPRSRPAARPTWRCPTCDRMDLAYAAADFALCRAGAMTCAELTAVGLPAAYVPLPHRQRRAAAERAADRRRAAVECWSTTPN